MKLVRFDGRLCKVVSKDDKCGTKDIEWFEGCEYDKPIKLTIGIDIGLEFESKFNVGDKVTYTDGEILEVVGYSGTYASNAKNPPVVFSERTWLHENHCELYVEHKPLELTNDELVILWYHMNVDMYIVKDVCEGEVPFKYSDTFRLWQRITDECRKRGICGMYPDE
jgi:hypothetical protein